MFVLQNTYNRHSFKITAHVNDRRYARYRKTNNTKIANVDNRNDHNSTNNCIVGGRETQRKSDREIIRGIRS